MFFFSTLPWHHKDLLNNLFTHPVSVEGINRTVEHSFFASYDRNVLQLPDEARLVGLYIGVRK